MRPSPSLLPVVCCVFLLDGALAPAQSQPAPSRVASLSPALTQIAVDLGRADWIVAVGTHDAALPDLPQVGNYLAPNVEALLSVNPDTLLIMSGKEGVHPQLTQLAERQRLRLLAVPVPHSVREVLAVIGGADSRGGLGAALHAETQAHELVQQIQSRLATLREMTSSVSPRRVLLVINTNPLWASGPGTVEDDLLSYCGAVNALKDARTVAVAVDRERLLSAQPQVIVLLSANAPPLGPLDSDPRLAEFRGLDIPAVRQTHIALLADPKVMLVQSSALASIAVDLTKAIHPELAPQIDAAWASSPVHPETQP